MNNGISYFRCGAYKLCSCLYDFQGVGIEASKISDHIRKNGLLIVSEIIYPRDLEIAVNYIDVIQIRSCNMQNYALFKVVGKSNHFVL